MTTFFKHLSQIHTRADYKKVMKSALGKADGERFYFLPKFEFDDREAPLLLVGEVAPAVLSEVKKKGDDKDPAGGKCAVDEDGGIVLHVAKGVVREADLLKVLRGVDFMKPGRIAGDDDGKLKTKKLGDKYKDEDKKVGWRKQDNNLPDAEDGDRVTTKYYDETEKENSRLRVDGGKLKTGTGAPLDGKRGFVIDPETGEAHVFEKMTAADQRRVASGQKAKLEHHSTPLAGGDVAGAGHIKAEKGVVKQIDDASGHYKPDAELTLQAVKQLKKKGVKLRDDATEIEAKVSLVGKMGLSEAEFAEAKGDLQAVNQLLRRKFGDLVRLPDSTGDSTLTSLPALNLAIGEAMKLTLTVSQFEQTEGNERQARNKYAVNEVIRRGKITDPADVRVAEMLLGQIDALGGEAALSKMGLDPEQMELGEQLQALNGSIDADDPMTVRRWGTTQRRIEVIQKEGLDKQFSAEGIDTGVMTYEELLAVHVGEISLEDARSRWPLQADSSPYQSLS